jgi:hypothetical protein
MDAFQKIAEQKIQEALQNGEFEHLPGKGKPLVLEDDSRIPEDLRLVYKILKNANCLPPELELKKEITQMKELLDAMPDEQERLRLIKKINLKITKLNMMRRVSPLLEEHEVYYKKIVEKLSGGK